LLEAAQFWDMEIRAKHPAGSLRAKLPGGVPVKWNEDTRVRVHRFPIRHEQCASRAEQLRIRHFRQPKVPARPYVFKCATGGMESANAAVDVDVDSDPVLPSNFWHAGCK
jgi:hypothetical protein